MLALRAKARTIDKTAAANAGLLSATGAAEARAGGAIRLNEKAFLAAFDALPEGTFHGACAGRSYVVSRAALVGGRSWKPVAEELGGADYVSLNLYRTAGGTHLRPSEMPVAKVAAFVLGFSARPEA